MAHAGSPPIAPVLREALDAPLAVMRFALPRANMRAPDERLPRHHVERGIRTMLRLCRRPTAP